MPLKLFALLLVLVLTVSGAPADETKTRCSLMGAVFGIDPFGGSMLLKDSGGYIKTIELSSSTKVLKIPVGGGSPSTMRPGDLNTGDLLCVQMEDGKSVTQISVVSRVEVHRAQQAFLADWLRNSVYGTVSSVDTGGRVLVVKPLPPSMDRDLVRVSLPDSVRLRAAQPESRRLTDSVAFPLEELRAGEEVYIRGIRKGDGGDLTASLVLKGGYRGIVGTLTEVKVFDSALRIQEFGSGRNLLMKITPGELYRTTENLTDPMRVQTQSGVVLSPVNFADLETGDAIMVVGKATADSAEGSGVIAVTRFGTFGVAPQDPQERMTWLLAK